MSAVRRLYIEVPTDGKMKKVPVGAPTSKVVLLQSYASPATLITIIIHRNNGFVFFPRDIIIHVYKHA
jgi:hypothetical protein